MSGFVNHSRLYADNRYVYPVVSRRSGGLSIGINLSPDQRCNFSCIYCQVDRSEKRPYRPLDLDCIDTELRAVLRDVADGTIWNHERFRNTPATLRRLTDIAFSGDGEPTLETGFPQVVQRVIEIKKALCLDALKVVVITNASGVGDSAIRDALGRVLGSGGEVWAKLDAGTEARFRQINGGPVSLDQIEANLSTLAAMGAVTIQSLFMCIDGIAPSDKEISAYLGRLARIKASGQIAKVQVYTIARKPRYDNVASLPANDLDGIAAKIRQQLFLDVEVAHVPAS